MNQSELKALKAELNKHVKVMENEAKTLRALVEKYQGLLDTAKDLNMALSDAVDLVEEYEVIERKEAEAAMQAAGISGGGTKDDFTEIIPQVQPNPGMPERKASARHRERVLAMLPEFTPNVQDAILRSIAQEDEIKAQNRGEMAQAHAATAAAPTVALGKSAPDYAGDDAVTQSWAVAPGLVDGPTEEYEVPNEGGRHSSTEIPDNRS